jgi:signal transduction histidine kinase/AmiR/NasT family two-component response regulator
LPSNAESVTDVWPSDSRVAALLVAAAALAFLYILHRLQKRTDAERAARLEAERKQALADNLHQLIAAISRARTPSSVIEVSLPEFLHAIRAAAGAFVMLVENGRSGEVVRVVGCDEPPTSTQFPLATYPALASVTSRHAIASFDLPSPTPADASRVPVLDSLASAPAAISIPLVTAGRAIAVLVVSFRESRNFLPDEREFLLSAGRRTAEAYVRAQAYETAERARADAEAFRTRADAELYERQKAEAALRESETKYRALAARTNRLYELSAALSESITVKAVAKSIVRHGKTALGASAGGVALLNEDRTRFEILYGEAYAEQPAAGSEGFDAGPGLCSTEAVETRKPVLISSFAECQQRYWRSASIAADGGFTSAAFLPLIVDDVAIGMVAFHFTAPVHFDEAYSALLMSVAQHCTQAIDRARLYETAQQARAAAEMANQSKDDFLSTVSHELRTPLTAVLGWASMLRNGSLDTARTARAVEAIFNNATRQSQMIEELLDISRIVGGRVEFDLQQLDLSDVVSGAIESIMPQADAKGVELQLGHNPSVAVIGDPRRLEQVFLNLLSNAVKFTQPGGHVSVDVVAGAQTVEARVVDNGAGIDPTFLAHAFDRFRQGDHSTARSKGGLGLGLFIARQLIEAHGGTIRAESAGPGLGAVFAVTLPIARSARSVSGESAPNVPDERDAAIPSLTGIRVLIVDDEPDVRELMVAALEHSGATVTAVGSAADALKVLSRADVDVLLADIAMPGQDGYDLIKATRALSSSRAARVPAAAVTACARDDERQRALAAGFQRHVPKPVQPETLVLTVAALARKGPAAVHAMAR